MNWSEYPYIRIALSFTIGIFVYEYFSLGVWFYWILLGITSLCYICDEVFGWNALKRPHLTGALFIAFFFAFGSGTMAFRKHLDNYRVISSEQKQPILLVGIVQENLKSATKLRYLFRTESYAINKDAVVPHVSDVIIQFDKEDSLATTYLPGDLIALNAKLSYVSTSTNPESFDYAYFLRSKGILQQAYIKVGHHHLISVDNFNIFRSFAERTKLSSSETLHKYIVDQDVLGIAEALLLGKKSLLTSDVYQDFANTGAIHVLSVSGLHVAIFISLFIWLFDKIKLKNNYYIFFKVLSLLLIVAFYVVLTGMSPSVLRAGFMVCLYIIGKNFYKNANTYNILSISAIVILCYDPYYLFQISFQFSYLSLLSILYFQPKIKKWWLPESKVLQFVWDLVNVSLAAQVLVFPLTIFYFHKFPMYFMLSGVIAVPIVSILIYLGTFMLVFEHFFSLINKIFAPIFNVLLEFLQKSISFLADLPYSIWDSLWIEPLTLIMCYLSIFAMMIWLEWRRLRALIFCLAIFYLVIVSISFKNINEQNTEVMYIYDVHHGVIIDGFTNNSVKTIRSSTILDKTINFVALNNRIKHNISTKFQENHSLDSVKIFIINNKIIYILDSNSDFERLKSNTEVDYLVISKSKKTDPAYILSKIKPQNVILDKNVPPWIIEKWETYSGNQMFSLHNIKKEGAYCTSLD